MFWFNRKRTKPDLDALAAPRRSDHQAGEPDPVPDPDVDRHPERRRTPEPGSRPILRDPSNQPP